MTTNQFFSPEPPLPPPKESISYPGTRSLSGQSERRHAASDQGTPTRNLDSDRRQHTVSPPAQPPELDVPNHAPSSLPNGDTSPAELNNAWSTAVGRATAGGKSGRVIERLMNDNDRLLREKRLATVKLEEELKRGESARSALESLDLSNANLTSLHESDVALLAKRDRRIQQLREDLEAERAKREAAEKETRETRQERDATVDRLQRRAAEHKEKYLRATAQYEMLSSSWKSLEDRYIRQTKSLVKDVADLRSAIDVDKQRLAQMEIIMEQMAQESEKSRKAKDRLLAGFEAYKSKHEDAIRGIREVAGQNDEVNDRTQRQMLDLLGHMRYVVNVKTNVKDAA